MQNILNQGDDLQPLIFNYASEYNMGLKLCGKHQLLVYDDDVNVCGKNINTRRQTQKLYSTLVWELV
jgi:hypothetical protein